MYVTIRRYTGVDVESIQQTTQARDVDEEFAPLISEMPGFQSYYLVDVGNGNMVAISVYLGEAEARESTKLALEWVKNNRSSAVPNAPEIIEGDVILHRGR